MPNTPIRDMPYRDILIAEDGLEVECIVFEKTVNGIRLRIDDEKAGDENGKILEVEFIQ